MGKMIKQTDLSWELPGFRANVDLPLGDVEFLIFNPTITSNGDSQWYDTQDDGPRDDDAPGLEDLQ
jgi:hypothetical protein